MADNYQPLMSEILDKVSKLKTKKEKVAHLQHHNTPALRMILKASFDNILKEFKSHPEFDLQSLHQRLAKISLDNVSPNIQTT
jgi:hypothetical protein